MVRYRATCAAISLWLLASASALGADFNLPAPSSTDGVRDLKATRYYVYPAVADPNGLPLLDINNRPISQPIRPIDYCKGAIEGTIRAPALGGLMRTFNYADHRGAALDVCKGLLTGVGRKWRAFSKSRYRYAHGEFGDGTRGYRLVPYRTVATDPTVIPTGTVLFIPSARGLVVKTSDGNQFTHDGYFFAADVGGIVKGRHLDIFTGTDITNTMPTVIGGDAWRTPVVLVEDLAIRQAFEALHKPDARRATEDHQDATD